MRRNALFLLFFLLCGTSVSAQEEECTVLGIQDLAQLYHDLILAHEDLQEAFLDLQCITSAEDNLDGTLTITLSDSSSFDLVLAISGCTDPAFAEYNAMAMLDDGSCETAQQGGCTDSTFVEFDPAAEYDDGSCATAPLASCVSPTMDGYTYDVVQIGNQCWMAENLRTTVYADGEDILFASEDDTDQWIMDVGIDEQEGQYSFHEDGGEYFDLFGVLYNAYAVTDQRGVCPEGWHVPSDEEWKTLELELGMSAEEVDAEDDWRGDKGTDLKGSPSGYPNWDGTNASGFNALAAGRRGWNSGGFADLHVEGFFWSRTPAEEEDEWYYRTLDSGREGIKRDVISGRRGHSVRCVEGMIPELLVEGCLDEDALNFDALANVDAGNCEYAADGDGDLDNGEEEETNACQGQDVLTYGGDAYDLVSIGDQCWFATNLATTLFANGDAIPAGLENGEQEDQPAQDAYDQLESNAALYGRLYNGYAVLDERGLCPTGWHVASDEDWQVLEVEMGMSPEDAEDDGWRGEDEGHRLKSSPEDSPGWDGENEVGFSAVAGGNWDVDDGFENIMERTYIWTSSIDPGGDGWRRRMQFGEGDISKSWQEIWKGYSVRCIRTVLECSNPAAANYGEEEECCYDLYDGRYFEFEEDDAQLWSLADGQWRILNVNPQEDPSTSIIEFVSEDVDYRARVYPTDEGFDVVIGDPGEGLGQFSLRAVGSPYPDDDAMVTEMEFQSDCEELDDSDEDDSGDADTGSCTNPAALNYEEEAECCYDFADATLVEVDEEMPEATFTEDNGAWEIAFNWDTREGDITFSEGDVPYSITSEELDLPEGFALQFFIGGEDSGLGSFLLIEGEGEETPDGYTAPWTFASPCDEDAGEEDTGEEDPGICTNPAALNYEEEAECCYDFADAVLMEVDAVGPVVVYTENEGAWVIDFDWNTMDGDITFEESEAMYSLDGEEIDLPDGFGVQFFIGGEDSGLGSFILIEGEGEETPDGYTAPMTFEGPCDEDAGEEDTGEEGTGSCTNPAALNFEEEAECCYDFADATLVEIEANMPEATFTEDEGAWEIAFNWDTREGDITFSDGDLVYSITSEELDLPEGFALQFFIGGEDSGLGSFLLIEGDGEETPDGYTAPWTFASPCD